ncbi:hypothetical protein FB451DRAFT_1555605 [Mycena latifolia]|nr:hypothetical protein FB451DRAFT_1555605 [Mycena latifolia]
MPAPAELLSHFTSLPSRSLSLARILAQHAHGRAHVLVYFGPTVSCPARDLHSGVFGRTLHESMTGLVVLMGRLVSR